MKMFENLYGKCGVLARCNVEVCLSLRMSIFLQVVMDVQWIYICLASSWVCAELGATLGIFMFPINGHLKTHFHGTRCMNAQVGSHTMCVFVHMQLMHVRWQVDMFYLLSAGFFICHVASPAQESHECLYQHKLHVSCFMWYTCTHMWQCAIFYTDYHSLTVK